MSLINEALKRARIEAARREAAAKGVPPSALPVYVPRRRRPWLAPLVGFGAGLAAVAVAAGGYWLARGARPAPEITVTQTQAPPPAAVPADEAAASAPPVAPAPSVEPPAPRSDAGTRAAPPEARVAAPPPRTETAPPPPVAPQPSVAPAVTVPPPQGATQGAPPPRAAPRQPTPEATAPLTRVRGLEEGRTYRLEVKPVGLEPIKLDFIVWSASPFAQINGRQVSPGQSVDGYQLLAVERERVQLEGGGVRFWLRAR